jgi:hypothetical protein
MQLTKDDVKTDLDIKENYDDYGFSTKYLDLSKFLKVRKFYEDYKDKDWCEALEPLWRHRDMTIRNWNDWLFNYCFKDRLK